MQWKKVWTCEANDDMMNVSNDMAYFAIVRLLTNLGDQRLK